jgi:hypothetical protein
MPAPPIVVQTIYAELLERCGGAAFDDAFIEDGAFTPKTIKGRRYWYFQTGTGGNRKQLYVGAETPELLERIERHQTVRSDESQRRALVSTLVRSFNLPRPNTEMGGIIEGLANAGVFRLRGILVGTIAYQTYMAMLGVKLSTSLIQTADIDIAQFKDVSVAIGDNTPPVLDVLREIDPTFRDIPSTFDGRHSTSYAAKSGVRVDFLTSNRGSGTDKPQTLPAFGTDAQSLPFLDYLIHEPEPAVVLHNAGIYVQVPAPQRYAIHKLIVSRRRPQGTAKGDKDLQQAEALLGVLAERRPYELKLAWQEAYARGKTWRQLLTEAISKLDPSVRDIMLKVTDVRRSTIPGLDLTFDNPPAHYDFHRDIVTFNGTSLGSTVACAVSRETLDDHFGADGLGQNERLQQFLKNRSKIELMARTKYLTWPIEEPGAVLVRTTDVRKLLSKIPPVENHP